MGLDSKCLDALVRNKKPEHTTILCLGYPDLLVPQGDLEKLFEILPGRSAFESQIQAWHNWTSPVYDTTDALRLLGLEPTYVDIKPGRGVEVQLDLNRSVWHLDLKHPLFGKQFDVVVDFGTLEHCFNIGQAFENVKALCAPGGLVIHSNPLNRINHGFWSISPTTYFDYWEHCGGTVVEAIVTAGPLAALKSVDIMGNQFKRFDCPTEANVQVVVTMSTPYYGAGWPTQFKYLETGP